jgi:hypothetical protein
MARLMLVIAIVTLVMLGALFVSAPQTMGGGMQTGDPGPLPTIVLGAGILAYVVGLATMIRIYRSDPEAHQSFWRSSRD